jgi:DNA-binding transcriptional MerR regulator
MRRYQVKEVAELAGVSVRTLHYYDELGLLVPSDRTAAGYRVYTDDDLLRLQQIVIQRELGLPLEEIRRFLDDPSYDRRAALVAQRAELVARATRTKDMLRAIDLAIDALDGKEIDMKDLFEKEAEERWGETDSWRISKERTARYTDDDWAKIKAEQAAVYRELAALLVAGTPPAGAGEVVERHRLVIDRWFYPCSERMHRALADLYENDARFAANIDQHGAGLTAYLCAAIRAR